MNHRGKLARMGSIRGIVLRGAFDRRRSAARCFARAFGLSGLLALRCLLTLIRGHIVTIAPFTFVGRSFRAVAPQMGQCMSSLR